MQINTHKPGEKVDIIVKAFSSCAKLSKSAKTISGVIGTQ